MTDLRLLVTSLALGAMLAFGCTGGGTPPNPDDDDMPLSDLDAVTSGAPGNENLPDIGKADAVYPPKYSDLVALQSPVKSQGSRGVCTIFSSTALVEHLYIKKGFKNVDFSEQYLQWATKVQSGEFTWTEGSNNASNLETVVSYGVVEEAAWPYETLPWGASNNADCGKPEAERPVVCFTNGDPPETAKAARKYKLPRSSWLSSRANNIKAHMTAKKTAVVVGVDFFYQSWNHGRSTIPINSGYSAKGYVLFPNDKDVEESHKHKAGHGILLVGWDDELEVQKVDGEGKLMVDAAGKPVNEKGFFIFKNSWGTGRFGTQNPHGAGYGFISQKYIEKYGNAVIADLPAENADGEVCNDGVDNDGNGKTDCADAACAADPACVSTGGLDGSATPNLAIPDNTPAGVSSEISITSTANVATVKVTVDITHTYVGDLKVTLTHGDKTVTLQANQGGGTADLKKTFTVDGFAGVPAGGAWKLTVADTASMDEGTLNSWSIAITTP
jgi:C1A family cysteine protease